MMTGECPPPFYSDFPLDVIEGNYRAFIGKCTEKEPVNRFQSIQEMLSVFDNIK